uniref:Uncharacterized protein n=1 Tax=Meloidogyne enterolobii TaxID=390850 RepID=A0A6V7UW71_MELEN|nr:unnamed protein product [Meloidogyne enterolobii]
MSFVDKKFCTILVILLFLFTIQCIAITNGEPLLPEHHVKPSVPSDLQKDDVQHNEDFQHNDTSDVNGSDQETESDGQTIVASINTKQNDVRRSKKLSDKTLDFFDGKHVPDDDDYLKETNQNQDIKFGNKYLPQPSINRKSIKDDFKRSNEENYKPHSNKAKLVLPEQRKPEVISRDFFRPIIGPVAYGFKGLMKLVKKPFKKSNSKQLKPTMEENF